MMRNETHDRYIKMVLLYCNGVKIANIAAQYNTTPRNIDKAFESLRLHYNAVSTPNLITILFRKGIIN